jgi:hypothetical protein
MALTTVRYGASVDINSTLPPQEEYMFYVIPPLETHQQKCLSLNLRRLGPDEMFSVVDYSGVVSGVIVKPVENGPDLPLPRKVLSAIGGCVGRMTLSPLPARQ